MLQKGNDAAVEETSAYAKKPNPIISEKCRANGSSVLGEVKAMQPLPVMEWEMPKWLLVAYKKPECLGNSFVRTSEKAFGKKALPFYPSLMKEMLSV